MKLLFLGCSWTRGCELGKPDECRNYRYSTIIGRRLDAEVVNLSADGRSNHAIARIFLEQDLSQYDRVFVQMTHSNRFEWYDPIGKSQKAKLEEKLKISTDKGKRRLLNKHFNESPWTKQNIFNYDKNSLWDRILSDQKRQMITGNNFEGKEWWIRFYEEIYDDKLGESEEYMYFHLFKNRLTVLNIPHLIFSINSRIKLPIDLQFNQNKYPRSKGNHPNKIGHIMISNDILKLI